MPYLLIKDFKGGLDTRRTPVTTPAGSLLELKNTHLTRGAEIEKRKAFVETFNLAGLNTFGLHGASNNLYVFGQAAAPSEMPPGINYQRLEHPTGIEIDKIIDTENFNGKIYSIVKYLDGNIYHFYDGTRVTDWDTIGMTIATLETIAYELASQINQDINFYATSNGAVITVISKTNDQLFQITATATNGSGGTDDQTLTVATVQNASVDLPQISTITVAGTLDAGDSFKITLAIPSTGYTFDFLTTTLASGTPKEVITFGSKMYAIIASLLYFCKIDLPTAWNATTDGAGVINLSNHDAGSEFLTALGVYQGKLAVFSRRVIQIWSMDANPDNNVRVQTLRNTGTRSPDSVVNFGDVDVFYYSDTGCRSMKARDASNSAVVSDVGTSIDVLIEENTSELAGRVIDRAIGIIEPKDGRYWLSIDDIIYVYSYFSNPTGVFSAPNVAAWSTYEPGWEVEYATYVNGRIYVRSGEKIYLYGGSDGKTYDSCRVRVRLPFLDADKPAHQKTSKGVDMMLEGAWKVYMGGDVQFQDNYEKIGDFEKTTYGLTNIFSGNLGTHFSLLLESESEGYARIGNCCIHYETGESG